MSAPYEEMATKNLNPVWPAMMVIAIIAAATCYSRQEFVAIGPYVALMSIGSGVMFLLLNRVRVLSSATLFGVALVINIIALYGFAPFEDDYFRFIWDGWRTVSTGTPYGISPSEFFGQTLAEPGLALTLDGVNNPDIPTIYGPNLQILFALSFLFGGASPLALKILFACVNLAITAILAKVTSPQKAAFFAWSPLVIIESIINIHPDAIIALWILVGLSLARKYPVFAGIAFGIATASKFIALAIWPLLIRVGPRSILAAIMTTGIFYAVFLFQGQGVGLGSTTTFATHWYFNPLAFAPISTLLPNSAARMAAAVTGILIILLLHARTRRLNNAPVAMIFAVILVFAPAVNSWYLLWLLPFAAGNRMVWPYAMAVALPLSYLNGFNLDHDMLDDFQVHPVAWATEVTIILAAIIWDYWNYIHRNDGRDAPIPQLTPISEPKIAVVIPALNEESSIGTVVENIRSAFAAGDAPHIIVADNGSYDKTADIATLAGAHVIYEGQRGYGAACLAGLSILPDDINIILFMDADGADTPAEAPELIAPITSGQADLVIGSRALGRSEMGAMTMPQRFGNWLSTRLVLLIWGRRMTDLGPFRAIRRDALTALSMADRDFGWTIEMQVKAVQHDMRIIERPADYRRRTGVSKISGTISGVFRAGTKILYIIGREAFAR